MTYVLVVWSVVACGYNYCKSEWKPLAEFHYQAGAPSPKELCETAAKSLVLTQPNYRCLRTK